jgi:hypothetical protein
MQALTILPYMYLLFSADSIPRRCDSIMVRDGERRMGALTGTADGLMVVDDQEQMTRRLAASGDGLESTSAVALSPDSLLTLEEEVGRREIR